MAKAKKLQNCMESGRLLLRPWLESDAEALFKYASDPEVGPRAGWPPHQNVKESLEIIRTLFHNDTTWAIVLKETDEPVGAIGYGPSCECNLPAREDEPLIGYWVGKPYWNQGICTEALQLMLDHISRSTGIPSLISGHFTDNPASGRVMEKCGFTPTGETCIDESQYMGNDRPIRVLRWENPKAKELENVLSSKEIKELDGIETFEQLVRWFFNPLKIRVNTIFELIFTAIALIIGICWKKWTPFVVIVTVEILVKGYLLLYEWKLVKALKEYKELTKEDDNEE